MKFAAIKVLEGLGRLVLPVLLIGPTLCIHAQGTFWKQLPWNKVPSPPATATYFFNDTNGWLVGSSTGLFGNRTTSMIASTRDGGETWERSIFRDKSIDDVFFVSPKKGWVVGTLDSSPTKKAMGIVFETSDGGKTWSKRSFSKTASSDYYLSIYFTSPTHGFISGAQITKAGRRSTVLESNDGGKSWKLAYTGDVEGGGLAFGGTMKFDPSGRFGIISGESGGRLLMTANGGASWRVEKTPFNESPVLGIEILNASDAWVTTDSGTFLRTADGGSTWTKLEITASDERTRDILENTRLSFRGIAFINGNRGWICGNDGLILGTADGGQTWTTEFWAKSGYLSRLKIADRKIFAVGVGPLVLSRDL